MYLLFGFSRTFPSTPPTDSAPREENGRRNLTFVTLDGQQSTGKGVLTGGYYPVIDFGFQTPSTI